jgi:hypothetical protein
MEMMIRGGGRLEAAQLLSVWGRPVSRVKPAGLTSRAFSQGTSALFR